MKKLTKKRRKIVLKKKKPSIEIIKKSKRILQKPCLNCKEIVIVKWNTGSNQFSQKNDWFYWTERHNNKEQYICNKCLLDLCYNNSKEWHKQVTSPKKRNTFSSYVYSGVIS